MRIVPFEIPREPNQAIRVHVSEGPHFYDSLHQHPEIQITLIQSGSGLLLTDDCMVTFGPGDVYVLGEQLPHVFRCEQAYYEAPAREPVRSVSVFFNYTCLGEPFWQTTEMREVRKLMQLAAHGLVVRGHTRELAADGLEQLTKLEGLPRLLQFLNLLQLLVCDADIASLTVAPKNRVNDMTASRRMQEVLHFTFENSHRRIALAEVAQVAQLSPESFCRYFKLHTGKTYLAYLYEVRIAHACRLLLNTDKLVSVISREVGFNTLSNFNRVFVRQMRQTPVQYALTGKATRR